MQYKFQLTFSFFFLKKTKCKDKILQLIHNIKFIFNFY